MYRVTATDPWGQGETHAPGCIARYTLALDRIKNTVKLETQSWGDIRCVHFICASNIAHTYQEYHRYNQTFYVVFAMKKGPSMKFSFESQEDASRCHQYFYDILKR